MTDLDPPPRQPVFNVPAVVVGLIVTMALIHGLRAALPDATDGQVLLHLAYVPGRFAALMDPAGMATHLQALLDQDAEVTGAAAVALFFLGDGALQAWTLLTYALLHGSWTHLGLNAVWLLAFGAPLARRFGTTRFLVFCAGGAVAGAAAHTLVDPFSLMPLIGASAAVSACMGAALRFLFIAPRRDGLVHAAPRHSLRAVLTDRRSIMFLLAWAVTNLLSGVAAGPLGMSDMPIAWQAHIGGFLFGLLGFALFDARRQDPRPDDGPGPDGPSPEGEITVSRPGPPGSS